MKPKKVTGGGKDGSKGSDDAKERARASGLSVVEGEGDLPAPLPPVDDPKKPAGIITPHGFVANRMSYRPPEPSQETLMKADHAEWLKNFTLHMALDTGVPMTAFRQGAITRLFWAYRYLEFLEKRNQSLQERLSRAEASASEQRREDQT